MVGLTDWSSQPHSLPRDIANEKIERLSRERWTGVRIAQQLDPGD